MRYAWRFAAGSMNELTRCPVCTDFRATADRVGDTDVFRWSCPLCGVYELDGGTSRRQLRPRIELIPPRARPRLIEFIRRVSTARAPIRLAREDLADPQRLGLPASVSGDERRSRILTLILERSGEHGEPARLSRDDWPLAGCDDVATFESDVSQLLSGGLIRELPKRLGGPRLLELTSSGLAAIGLLPFAPVRFSRGTAVVEWLRRSISQEQRNLLDHVWGAWCTTKRPLPRRGLEYGPLDRAQVLECLEDLGGSVIFRVPASGPDPSGYCLTLLGAFLGTDGPVLEAALTK